MQFAMLPACYKASKINKRVKTYVQHSKLYVLGGRRL
jgi:hypothetical protein